MDMKKINPEYVEFIRKQVRRSPYSEFERGSWMTVSQAVCQKWERKEGKI